MAYRIFAALASDVSEGLVWLRAPGLPSRCIVRIRRRQGKRDIFCEALQFDDNFLCIYNQKPRFTIANPDSSIVMGSWYRARLGDMQTQETYDLEVVSKNTWWGRLRACMHHPQIIVRSAIWLGAISVSLGLIGIVLAAPGVLQTLRPATVSHDGSPTPGVEWHNFLYPDVAAMSGVPIDQTRFVAAPAFRSLQDCIAWGRKALASQSSGFECSLGCRFDSSVGEVVCVDSTRILR